MEKTHAFLNIFDITLLRKTQCVFLKSAFWGEMFQVWLLHFYGTISPVSTKLMMVKIAAKTAFVYFS